jgi:hypothetical protein
MRTANHNNNAFSREFFNSLSQKRSLAACQEQPQCDTELLAARAFNWNNSSLISNR